MKALSLKEPWATAIMLGYKQIETRGWNTRYRGSLLIHASMSTDKESLSSKTFQKILKDTPLNNGFIIAQVNLVDTIEMTEEFIENIKKRGDEYYYGIYGIGRFAWIFDDIKIINPRVEAQGHLGLWDFKIE